MKVLFFVLLSYSSLVFSEGIILNFRDTDIRALTNTVSEIVGKSFVLDPTVSAKITLYSPQPLEVKEVYQVFESVLSVHGYSIVPSGSIFKIVPAFSARLHSFPLSGGFSTHVLRLQYVSGRDVNDLLEPLLSPQGLLSAYSNILVLSDISGNAQRLVQVVEKIDKPLDAGVEIIPLQYASVSEVLPLLDFGTQVVDSKSKKSQEQVLSLTSVTADSRTNTLFISGTKQERLRLRAIVSHLDTPLLAIGVETIYLKFAKVQKILPVLTGIIESDSVKYAGVSIQGYDSMNALILTASAEQIKFFKSIISTLDIRQAQVLVEAVIAEISVDKIRELGIQWFSRQSQSNRGHLAGVNFNNSGASITQFVAGLDGGLSRGSSSDQGSSPLTLNANAFMGLGRFVNGVLDFGILLQALHSDSKVNVLSTPSLLVLDNEPARISVGQNVPFVTGQYSNSENGGQNAFQTIQRQDVGITLEITPQIGSGGAVRLNVNQEVSSVSRANFAADIITNQRTIQTTVMAQDGGMIVLGGLIHEDLQQTAEKVPFLGDVPALGVLFRSNTASKVKRVLMVFLHPTIIKDSETDLQVARSKYDFARQYQISQNQQGTPLMTDSDVPVLDFNNFLTVLNGALIQ